MNLQPITTVSVFHKLILFIICLLLTGQLLSQKQQYRQDGNKPVPILMQPQYWEYDTATTEFVNYKNTPAVKSKEGKPYQLFLKNHVFTNGTIEFDVALSGMGFPGINFRMSDDRKNGENFYIRSFGPVKPEIRTTLQYAALIDGMSMWDLSDEYQSGAIIHQDDWNHVKLVIAGKQMKAYVNDMHKPSLIVPELESGRNTGTISLSGNVLYANLAITPNATPTLDSGAGYTSTYNDTRYLRNWQLTAPADFPFGKDVVMPLPSMYGTLNASQLPDSTTQWRSIQAENRGIVNLSRLYGAKEKDARRLAWLKSTINSDKEQEKVLRFGFSDEVWVFLNRQLIYVDKNYFGVPEQKTPKGRCTIENTELRLPLKQGNNEILIALANYFYGWGIIARLDDTDGLELKK